MAEVLRIHVRIPGVADAGDFIVHDPDHPQPTLRLCRLVPLAPDLLPVIRAHITRYPSGCLGRQRSRAPAIFPDLRVL